MSRLVYIDCFSGASGDMILGALIDLGLPIDELRRALVSLVAERSDFSIGTERVLRRVPGIAICHFTSADVVRHPLVARIVDAYDAQGSAPRRRSPAPE